MNPPDLTVTLSFDEVNLILDALGQQPYARVFALIESIHRQAAPQLNGGGAPDGGSPEGGPHGPTGPASTGALETPPPSPS